MMMKIHWRVKMISLIMKKIIKVIIKTQIRRKNILTIAKKRIIEQEMIIAKMKRRKMIKLMMKKINIEIIKIWKDIKTNKKLKKKQMN